MLSLLKKGFWFILARFVGWGATLIRRKPSGGGPVAWRSVHFSYSLFGEDLVVLHLLKDPLCLPRGCFVDIGAFHPVLHSNTYLLYQYGWRGLNVDASPARIALFERVRPGDKHILAAVSDLKQDVFFLEYPTSGTSRIVSAGDPNLRNGLGEEPISVSPQRTQTLTDLLEEHLDQSTGIDFLNIDCEGVDLAVLRGLDWARWQPRVIAVEANSPQDVYKIDGYLRDKSYHLVSKHLVTLIFAHKSVLVRLPIGMIDATAG
jgi:FkbM family methyltransferase